MSRNVEEMNTRAVRLIDAEDGVSSAPSPVSIAVSGGACEAAFRNKEGESVWNCYKHATETINWLVDKNRFGS